MVLSIFLTVAAMRIGTTQSRDAYIAAFAKDFEDPKSVRFERLVDSIEISASVSLAAEHGHWVGRQPGGEVIFSGTYLAMWCNTSSGWKLRSELFVSLACKDIATCGATANGMAQRQ